MPTGHRFLATDLHQFVNTLFIQLGSSPTEASLVADHLVAANLAGHDSLGVGMIPKSSAISRNFCTSSISQVVNMLLLSRKTSSDEPSENLL